MGKAARDAEATIDVLVEVDIGMHRCGVAPGEPTLALARKIAAEPGLRFVGLQGYDGHLQLLPDPVEKRTKALQGLEQLVGTRRLCERAGLPVELVTGAGTGTWEYAAGYDGMTEIQPGSFLLMDCAYHAIRPEFACSLTILSTVISRHPSWYVLDAGSKAISKDFGTPVIKGRTDEKPTKLAEEHTLASSRVQAWRSERRRTARGDPGSLLRDHEPAPEVRGGAARSGRSGLADRGERAV